jgi:hypothetical protein
MYDKIYYPYPATNKRHKFFIITDTGRKISFGQYGAEDYTTHYKKEGKEIADERKRLYIIRHKKREEKNWNKSGINFPSFWSYFLLWNKPTLEASYRDIQKNFL